MYYFSWMHVHRLFAYRYNLIHFLFEHKQSLSFSISIGLNTDWIQGLTVLVIYVLIFKICTQTLLQFWIYWMRLSRPAEFRDWLCNLFNRWSSMHENGCHKRRFFSLVQHKKKLINISILKSVARLSYHKIVNILIKKNSNRYFLSIFCLRL